MPYLFNNLRYKSNTVICLVAQIVPALVTGVSFRLASVSRWHGPILLFLSTSLLVSTTRYSLLIFYLPAPVPTPESTISQETLLPFKLSTYSFVFSMLTIISAINNESFVFSFPIFMLLIYFSCLTEMARASSTVMNRKDAVGILVLLDILEETPLTFL